MITEHWNWSWKSKGKVNENLLRVIKETSVGDESYCSLCAFRFNRRRIEEEVETVKTKVSRLRSLVEGSSAIQKLRQELNEFKEILKCKACNDRSKEVKEKTHSAQINDLVRC